MGNKTKQRVYLTRKPIVDVATDEPRVKEHLAHLMKNGKLLNDRTFPQVFPTVKTLIGALHLLPEVLSKMNPEQRARLASELSTYLNNELSDGPKALFSRMLKQNEGMSKAFDLMRQKSILADALAEAREEERKFNPRLHPEMEMTDTVKAQWLAALDRVRELEKAHSELNYQLKFTAISPTADKTIAVHRDFVGASDELRGSVLRYLEDHGDYSSLEKSARGWLDTFADTLAIAILHPSRVGVWGGVHLSRALWVTTRAADKRQQRHEQNRQPRKPLHLNPPLSLRQSRHTRLW